NAELELLTQFGEQGLVHIAGLSNPVKPQHAVVGDEGQLLAILVGREPGPAANVRFRLESGESQLLFRVDVEYAQLHRAQSVGRAEDQVSRRKRVLPTVAPAWIEAVHEYGRSPQRAGRMARLDGGDTFFLNHVEHVHGLAVAGNVQQIGVRLPDSSHGQAL